MKYIRLSLKNIGLSLCLPILCGAVVFIMVGELYPQDGMKISVRTETGEELPLYKESHALVIGNGSYAEKNGWTPLPGAVKDAKEVAEVLERQGFEVTLQIECNQG